MGASDIPQSERTAAHLAGCFALLGVVPDVFRGIWREASHGDRVMFLAFGGERVQAYANRDWDSLPADLRGRIRSGFERFKGWAKRVEKAGANA